MGGLCSSSSATSAVSSVTATSDVFAKKIATAEKTSVLSLHDAKLRKIPVRVFQTLNIKTLDLSQNSLTELPTDLANLSELKSLNCDKNWLESDSISVIYQLHRLEIFTAGHNKLGLASTNPNHQTTSNSFPSLPSNLRQFMVPYNAFVSIPSQVVSKTLIKLEKLDLSGNQIKCIPPDISNLMTLIEVNLDNNQITSIPESMGSLKSLKILSLQYNKIRVESTKFSQDYPQPIPAILLTSTPLIDLKLKGNQLTNTQLNEFDGFPIFLKRITELNTKKLYGGALIDYNVCGLE